MRFWIRELAGWGLILLGLCAFYQCFVWLSDHPVPRYTEAGPLTIIGIFLFRGGIHLLKVAVAARVCLEARDHEKTEKKPLPAPRRMTIPASPPAASRPSLGKQAV